MKTLLSVSFTAAFLALSSLAAAAVAPKLIHPLEGTLTHHVSPANPGCAARVAPTVAPATSRPANPSPAGKK